MFPEKVFPEPNDGGVALDSNCSSTFSRGGSRGPHRRTPPRVFHMALQALVTLPLFLGGILLMFPDSLLV